MTVRDFRGGNCLSYDFRKVVRKIAPEGSGAHRTAIAHRAPSHKAADGGLLPGNALNHLPQYTCGTSAIAAIGLSTIAFGKPRREQILVDSTATVQGLNEADGHNRVVGHAP